MTDCYFCSRPAIGDTGMCRDCGQVYTPVAMRLKQWIAAQYRARQSGGDDA